MIVSDFAIGERQMVPWESTFWIKSRTRACQFSSDFGLPSPMRFLHISALNWLECVCRTWIFLFCWLVVTQVTVGEVRKNVLKTSFADQLVFRLKTPGKTSQLLFEEHFGVLWFSTLAVSLSLVWSSQAPMILFSLLRSRKQGQQPVPLLLLQRLWVFLFLIFWRYPLSSRSASKLLIMSLILRFWFS